MCLKYNSNLKYKLQLLNTALDGVQEKGQQGLQTALGKGSEVVEIQKQKEKMQKCKNIVLPNSKVKKTDYA